MEEPIPMNQARRPARALQLVGAAVLLLAGCATVPAPEVPPAAPVLASPVALPEPAAPAEPAPTPAAAPDPATLTLVPFQPRFRLDPGQDAEHMDLWQRLRGGFQLPDLDTDLVRKWEQFYARDPAYVQRMTERGGRYLFHIVEEVNRRGMPAELALLPFIESAFNPQALSRTRASGMWQFMPGTGKDFELRQNLFRDDRRDVLASTRAALDYLQRLHGLFGDWHLALAAYNWGQGNVSRAIERNRRAGQPTDYLSLRMPQETRDYVPKLQAVKNIVGKPEAFGLALQPLQNHPFFLSVTIERDIDVALAAQLSGLSLDQFQQLNPQMNKPVILAAGTPQVLLPYDNANLFLRGMDAHRGAFASWTAWVAPKTLKPADAAKLAGMSEGQLREVNHIPPRMLVKAGSTLLVPRAAHATRDVSEHIADNGMLALAPEGRAPREVRVKAGRNGDSVAAVAKRYRVSAAQVAQWNGVSPQARFKAGQPIVVMLAPAPVRSAKAGHAVRKVAKAAPVRKKATPPKLRVAQR
jgi:membrane-bound lytic murein transglycosylase D